MGLNQLAIDEEQTDKPDNRGTQRYSVQPPGQSKLPPPVVTLLGLVAALAGWKLSDSGLLRGPFVALFGGWMLAVAGGA